MRAIYVALPSDAFEALRSLAVREQRYPRQQAVRLILEGLERSGTGPSSRPPIAITSPAEK
jgi:hypothetical protein